jgi:hypothetical protein
VDDGRHFDQLVTEPVHDTVVPEDELPKIFSCILRDDATGPREILQLLDVGDDALHEKFRVMR